MNLLAQINPEDASKVLGLIPQKYAVTASAVMVAIPYVGKAIHALLNGGGLKGYLRSVWSGSATAPQNQSAQPQKGTLGALGVLTFGLLTTALLGTTACQNPSLQSGGAYAPGVSATNAQTGAVTFTPTAAPDLQLYQADAAFYVAYTALDGACQLEYANRAMLYRLSPDIKHTLDKIRPDAWLATQTYLAARAAYLANPTPANASALTVGITKIQALSAAAVAATQTVAANK